MNESVGRMLQLEQYRCRKCDRLFYIESGDRAGLEWDFGCPFGCDDNGEYMCSIGSAIKKSTPAAARNEKASGRIRDHRIILQICPEEFELSMGRKPKSQAEFDQWAALAEKGLLNGHIDWDILYDCT
jgi:hypothetical protein